jgi:hypothetical protein
MLRFEFGARSLFPRVTAGAVYPCCVPPIPPAGLGGRDKSESVAGQKPRTAGACLAHMGLLFLGAVAGIDTVVRGPDSTRSLQPAGNGDPYYGLGGSRGSNCATGAGLDDCAKPTLSQYRRLSGSFALSSMRISAFATFLFPLLTRY